MSWFLSVLFILNAKSLHLMKIFPLHNFMDIYKNPINTINPDFPDTKEIISENDTVNLSIYFSNYEVLFSDSSINQKIIFLQECGNIYMNDDVIPMIIKSNFFDLVIESINEITLVIFDVLNLMVTCSFDNILLLFQNNMVLILILVIQNRNDIGLHLSIDCLSNILSQNYSTYENNLFILLLILSTNVLEKIFYYIQNENSNNSIILNSILYFLYNIFLLMPNCQLNCEYYENLYDIFSKNLKTPQIFQKNIYLDIIQNGISLSHESIYYQILVQLFKLVKQDENIDVIWNTCKLINVLLSYNESGFSIIFNDLDFFSCIDGWLNIQNPLINEQISVIIESLFIRKEIVNTFPDDFRQKICNILLFIFDSFDNFNDERTENQILKSFFVPISYIDSIATQFLIEKRRNFIYYRLNASEYKLTHTYAYFVLTLACKIQDYRQILNEEVLMRILEIMEVLDGEFVRRSLFKFDSLFEKHQLSGEKELLNSFVALNGLSILEQLADSENDYISDLSQNLMNKYFNAFLAE